MEGSQKININDNSSENRKAGVNKDEEEAVIEITTEDLKMMEKTIQREKEQKARKWNKVDYFALFKQNEKEKAFESISLSKQRSLIQCYRTLIYMLRVGEFKKKHLEYLKILKEMVDKYVAPVIYYLNTPDGIDALTAGYKVDKTLTLEILELCIKKSSDQEFLESELLIPNLVVLRDKYKLIKEISDPGKAKELLITMKNYDKYGLQQDRFAYHFFRYGNLKQILDSNEPLEAEDLIDLPNLEETFKDAEYFEDQKKIIEDMRQVILKTVNSKFQEIQDACKVYAKHIQENQDEISTETSSVILDNVSIGGDDIFQQDEKQNEELDLSIEIRPDEDARCSNIEYSDLAHFFKEELSQPTIYKVGESSELKRLIETWMDLKISKESMERETQEKIYPAEVFYSLLPRAKNGSLDMKFTINQDFVKKVLHVAGSEFNKSPI